MKKEIEELKAKIEEKKKEIDNFEIDPDNYIDEYDDMIRETSDVVKIGSLEYDPAYVLKEIDPTAYRCGLNDYVDAFDKFEIKAYQELEVELEEMENQLEEMEEKEEE